MKCTLLLFFRDEFRPIVAKLSFDFSRQTAMIKAVNHTEWGELL